MLSTAKANQAYTEREQLIQFWARQLDDIVEKEGEDLEGNCFYHGNTRMTSWFFLYKKINFVKTFLVKCSDAVGAATEPSFLAKMV